MQFSRRKALAGVAALATQGGALLRGQSLPNPLGVGITPVESANWIRKNGIPWEAALADAPLARYPKGVREHIERQQQAMPRGSERYIAFQPTCMDHKQLAANWEHKSGEPLPYPWNTFDFDHARVKRATLNYVKLLVETLEPSYLNIGAETNILLARNESHWPAYLDLHRHLYTEIKRLYPRLSVMVSVQYEHLIGLREDSQKLKQKHACSCPDILTREVSRLLDHSDLLLVSTDCCGVRGDEPSEHYFAKAAELAARAGIPLAQS